MIDILELKTKDLSEQNIGQLAKLFPNCISESRNKEGDLQRLIDFDLLKQELLNKIVDGPRERYQLNWPGKNKALLSANTPITKTLRPDHEESVNFNSTENLFIEGDNLDALKLLQETYLGKVKMIYIDPPYNTGGDFVYDDNFTSNKVEYDISSEQIDDEGRLVTNPETNGRFHSDWLDMIYPRLKLARNLLKDDGVIFISIDDHEVHNLRKVCDEIFGATNFFCSFIWQKRSGSMDSVDGVSTDHEYILTYGKDKQRLAGVRRTYDKYKNPDNDPRGAWISDNLSAGKAGGNVDYPITDPDTGNVFNPPQGRYWPYNPQTMAKKIEEGRVIFPKSSDGRPMLKRFQNEAKSQYLPVSTLLRNYTDKKVPSNAIVSAMNTKGTSEIQNLFGNKLFSFPKSTVLIRSLMSQATTASGGDIIFDFFAGSATTAHAVMQQNAEDGGNRKFIMVQLPEVTDEKSEAYKAGYSTIAEISKERIRRAGKKIKEDNADKEGIDQLDTGFRVLKVDSSNMKDVYYAPDAITQADLVDQTDNIKDDRTAEDLLFQVLLDWGVDLTLPINREVLTTEYTENTEKKTKEFEVFFVDGSYDTPALCACFDKDINEDLVKQIAKREPLRAVFRDAGYGSDSTKINIKQIFKLVSPHTEVKAI